MTTLRVVSAVADTKILTLYLDDGTTRILQQSEHRIDEIVEKIVPITNRGQVAVIDIDVYNVYADFQKQSNGLVRFFRIAKQKVMHLFGADPDDAPTEPAVYAEPIIREAAPTHQQILAQATEMTDSSSVQSTETVLAVVGTGSKTAIIPNAENLEHYIAHANKTNDPVGVQKFLDRVGVVISKRGHSVQDLLRFMEKGDLPIADDGSIVAYKILKRHDTKPNTFVDCHTRKVEQKVGSFVCVDEELVDKNRRNECSNGLHIARRGYLAGFSGDVCVLVKIAPEDVIAVPQYDANKVRVCGYHILFELPDNIFKMLKSNKPMTGEREAADLLARALAGKHVGRLEEVKIHGQRGEGVVITPLNADGSYRSQKQAVRANIDEAATKKAVALDAGHNAKPQGKAVAPRDINKMIQEEDAKLAAELEKGLDKELALPEPKMTNGQPTRSELAKAFYAKMVDETNKVAIRQQAAQDLQALKKKAKVSYEAMGLVSITPSVIEFVLKLSNGPVDVPPMKADPAAVKVEKKPAAKTEANAKPTSSRQKTARHYFDKKRWTDLHAFKRSVKIGWEKLGFNKAEIATIMKNLT